MDFSGILTSCVRTSAASPTRCSSRDAPCAVAVIIMASMAMVEINGLLIIVLYRWMCGSLRSSTWKVHDTPLAHPCVSGRCLVPQYRRQRKVECRANSAQQFRLNEIEFAIVSGRSTDGAQQGLLSLAIQAQEDVQTMI